MEVPVQIIRSVEEHQPPIVEAQFLDSSERCHKFIAKSAIFTTDWGLDAARDYPQPGAIGCEALARWRDSEGRELVRITTARPDDVESTDGLSEFVVLSTQLA